jgi:hypothetical protein
MPIKEKEEAIFTVFPNPVQAGALLTVSLSERLMMPEEIVLLSAHKQVVARISQNHMEYATVFNISIPVNATPGIYYIQLNSRNWMEPLLKMIMVK